MKTQYDVAIIGGGIVGMLTAYELSKNKKSVLVIDSRKIGSSVAASSGITRSLRNDYRDPRYSVLARKAWDKWRVLEQELEIKLVVKTGCLNIATDAIKVDSYARDAVEWLKRDGNNNREFVGQSQVSAAYPQFANIDYASLDLEAGVGLASKALGTIRDTLIALPKVVILENCITESIECGNLVTIQTNRGSLQAKKLLIAAGIGSPKVLSRIQSSEFQLKLTPDRPVECLYYEPSNPEAYTDNKLPIFANLDVGVYGHPIIKGVTKAVKIGMYAPPEIVTGESPTSLLGVREFVKQYLPELAKTSKITRVTNTDQCSYDMTADGNFVIGLLPDQDNVAIATGFCGTGFKFASITAEIVKELLLTGETQYNITAFKPGRL